jgi:hypothetical protein
VEIIGGKVLGSLKPMVYLIAALLPCWIFAAAIGAMSLLAIPLLLLWMAIFGFFAANLGVYQSLVRATTGRAIGFTFAIMAMLAGGGHLFGLSIMIPLQFFMNSANAWGFYMMSMPWIPLAGSAFTGSELNWFFNHNREMGVMVAAGLCVVVGYSIGASWLFTLSCRKFQSATGRIESELTPVIDRRPRPVLRPLPPMEGDLEIE